MKPRFQADADLNHNIVKAVVRKEPMIDFKTATAAQLEGLDDLQVLAKATHDGRVLVTHDRKTMPAQFAQFVALERCSGVIIVPQSLLLATAVDDLLLIWLTTDSDEWTNRICMLPL